MRRKLSAIASSPYTLLTIVGLGVFEAALDQTVVVTALPLMLLDMRVPPTELDQGAWIVTGYLLGYTAAMPLLGRIADVHGHRRLFVLALTAHMIGSALVALAPDLNLLIAARLLQAIGGGALVPVALALAADVFPPGRRGIALGVVAAAAEMGGVLGPLWGGVILELLDDWRWIFWYNIPLGVLVALPTLLVRVPLVRTAPSVDYAGGLLLATSIAALTLGLAGTLPGGIAVPQLPLVALSALLLALFVYRETRAKHPLIPLGFFRKISFSSANGAHLLLGGALIIAMVNIPLMANTALGQTPFEGGLRLMRLTIAIPFGAVIGGLATQRFGPSPPAVVGFALSAIGFLLMAGWMPDIADPTMTLHLATAGLGFGLVLAPVATATVDAVPEDTRAVASALVTSMRLMGMLLGLAALSSWGTGRFDFLVSDLSSPFPLPGESAVAAQARIVEYQRQITDATFTLFRDFFRVCAALTLIAIVPALGMGWRRRRTKRDGLPR